MKTKSYMIYTRQNSKPILVEVRRNETICSAIPFKHEVDNNHTSDVEQNMTPPMGIFQDYEYVNG